MNKLYSFPILLITLALSECGEVDYINNARIFATGKTNAASVSVQLIDSDILISETTTNADGTFSLGGPTTDGQPSIWFNKKISNFVAKTSGCTINRDSTAIILPERIRYIEFIQIDFE
ncbi:MAG: hypothetical protein Q4G16_06200 [Cruoricaptor ignavus]|nr:hypothetical protein [Cruoricaptor ignavus]